MKGDEGSIQIRAILERGSERLTQGSLSVVTGLKTVDDQEYGIPPQVTFDSLADVRQFYREVRAEVDAVASTNPAKAEVLSALDLLDRGFGGLERGLATGFSKKAVKRLRAGEKKLERGANSLVAARDRL
jgi:hypothetical protein